MASDYVLVVALTVAASMLGACVVRDTNTAETAVSRNSPDFKDEMQSVFEVVDRRFLRSGQYIFGFQEFQGGYFILKIETRTEREEQFSQDEVEKLRLACVEVAARIADALAGRIERPNPSDIHAQQSVCYRDPGPNRYVCVGVIPIHFTRQL